MIDSTVLPDLRMLPTRRWSPEDCDRAGWRTVPASARKGG
jgi:hypothetical protein